MKINIKKKICVFTMSAVVFASCFTGIQSKAQEMTEDAGINTATTTDAEINATTEAAVDATTDADDTAMINDTYISTNTDAEFIEEIAEENLLLSYSTISSDEAYDKMVSMESEYPTGTPWSNANSYKWNCGWQAWGCMGFAHMISDAAFGNAGVRTIYPSEVENIYDVIRVGDVVRVPSNHSVVVLEKYPDYIVICEGNASEKVRWGRTIFKDTILSQCTYIETRYAADAVTMTIGPAEITLENGYMYKLDAVITPVNPNATITWTSSDPSVIDVADDGTIIAKNIGKSVITATYEEAGISSSCEVECIPDFETRYTNVESFVTRLYEKCLDRLPDDEGMNTWRSILLSRTGTGASVAKGFVYSKEYIAKNVSDEEYLNMLYRVFLDREADAEGRNTWLGLMEQGVSRDYVFRGFVESVEYTNICNNYGIERGTVTLTQPRDMNPNMTKFVNRLYVNVLGRNGEEDGLNDWCYAIQNDMYTPVQVGDFFVLSDEFKAKNLSDEEYIKVLYRAYLGREYDDEGLNTWLGLLQSGTSRETVLRGFTNSVEFGEIIKSFNL